MLHKYPDEEPVHRELEKLRHLFLSMHHGILFLDNNGRVTEANPAAEKLFDRSCETMLGRTLHDLFQQLENENYIAYYPCMNACIETLQRGEAIHNQVIHFHNTQTKKFCWISFSATPQILHGNDSPQHIVALFEDITQYKRAQDKLTDSGRRHRIIFEKSPLGMVHFSPEGIIRDCNERFIELMGSSRDKLIGFDGLQRSSHPIRETLQKALAGQHISYEGTYTSITGNKTTFLRVVLNPVSTEHLPTEVIATLEDISERNEAEQALKESESRFRALVENVELVAVQGYDVNRRVTFWNKASEVLYGFSKEEALGRQLEDLIIPDPMRDDVKNAISNWMENGIPILAGELVLCRKDRSPIHVYSSHAMFISADGTQEMFCIDVDLTQMHIIHAELLEAKQAAESANKAKSVFLANMSHEIRTPLNGVMGMLQLLQNVACTDKQRLYTETALDSCNRLTRLLGDILDLSRVEAGKMNITHESFRLDTVLDAVSQIFEPIAQNKQIGFSISAAPEVPVVLYGDPIRLQQILNNLVGNAVKFTDTGSVYITVQELAAKGEQIRLLFTVRDTGIGIDDADISRIFDAFNQAETSFKRAYQGAGLGLSITKKLVQLLDGTLTISNEPGVGTTIYINIPFTSPPQTEVCSTPSPALSPPVLQPSPVSILVVEDDEHNRMFILDLLENKGFTTRQAHNGLEALQHLQQTTVDIILMDVQMPVMDGLEATRHIRSNPKYSHVSHVPIVAMTAYAMAKDEEYMLNSGMDGYIAKPVNVQQLFETMTNINRKKARPKHT
ncbi:PAS domain-containing hybrid sensor histidine kinase/response regulator [Desulfovibrio inopinatus]|uniref:PAS domain-containing hybrid sensor histidine kinase/response regulator n=1 Tax=Desulfovibrio inopinatus TaxID=102109 RepID=UPI00042A400E|nr:PAS domain-containing hybrid sensor histidine kinase/response regulator [Desulfovibrio inopinatus]